MLRLMKNRSPLSNYRMNVYPLGAQKEGYQGAPELNFLLPITTGENMENSNYMGIWGGLKNKHKYTMIKQCNTM
jgi:hypothetical protein